MPDDDAQTAAQTFLDLDQLPEQPKVQLKGKEYNIRTATDFSLDESVRIRREVLELQRSMEKTDKVDQDSTEYSEAIEHIKSVGRKMIKMVLEAPEEVIESLDARQQTAVLNFFMQSSSSALDSQSLANLSSS